MKYLLIAITLSLAGCTNHLLCAKTIEPYTDVILPEYEEYVSIDPKLNENEPGISDDLRNQRRRTKEAALKSVQGLKAAIERLKRQ